MRKPPRRWAFVSPDLAHDGYQIEQAAAPFATPVHTTEERFGRVPRAYVVCSQDQAIPPALQWRMLAEFPCDTVTTLDISHSPFISAPELLTAHLDHVANGAGLSVPSAAPPA